MFSNSGKPGAEDLISPGLPFEVMYEFREARRYKQKVEEADFKEVAVRAALKQVKRITR